MTPEEIRDAIHLLATAVRDLRDAEEARGDGIWCGPDTVGNALADLVRATDPENFSDV